MIDVLNGDLMSPLNSETVPVGKLFSEEFFFAIPDYQRPFSWDKDQIADLIDDLLAADPDSPYFLGTLVLHRTEASTYDVVDGQQRLTALSILLACLRDLLENDRDEIQDLIVQPEKKFQQIPSRPRLSVRDTEPYARIVCRVGGTKDLTEAPGPAVLSSAEERYRDAVSTFRERLVNLPSARLWSLTQYLIRNVVIIYLAASSFDDAFRLFTVVNDRGKQLRRVDILKAKNLSPSVVPDTSIREEYSRKWEAFEETLGGDEFEALFRAMRLIYVQEKPEGDLLHEFESRIYGKQRRPDPGREFIDELSDYVDLYDALFIDRDYLAGEKDGVRFQSLMFSMVREFKASEWRACILFFARKFGKTGLFDFLLKIEAVFVDHWVCGVRKDERYDSYTRVLKMIEGAATSRGVTDEIRVDLTHVKEACRARNFYGAGYSKYLLVRAEIQASELQAPREFSPRSVEHVLPQNPRIDSGWLKDFTDDERDELTHQVGNLVLLSKGKNSSAANKEYIDKLSTYLEPRVSDYPRSVQVVKEEVWTPEAIRRRTREFADNVLGAF